MKQYIIPSLGLAVVAGISLVSPALAVVNINSVFVGNVNNAKDAANGSIYGAVSYAYQIAKNETTISQYAEFLNAVAKTDTYGLYSQNMKLVPSINGISQSGSSGSFTYSVAPGSGNKPITYVSWFDAARFCNWLHNGQPVGLQDVGTTEGGAYTLNGSMYGVISKNSGAKVWIPSENEWYKAAYYDPDKGGTGVGGYWSQATQSNTLAGNTVGAANSANVADEWGNYATYKGGLSWGITDVGAYGEDSDSAYGTNDQAGNVWEWNDVGIAASSRVLRGGGWGLGIFDPASSGRIVINESAEAWEVGFRVAGSELVAVPEPTSMLATLALISSGLLLRRRGKISL